MAIPGVPALPPGFALNAVALLGNDVIGAVLGALFGQSQWGIYDESGTPVVVAQNVVSVEYRQDWIISDYPVEQGGFMTYNKVQMPFDFRIRFSSGGSEETRQRLLDSIADIARSTELFNAVTPEATYVDVNIAHYDYRRESSRGVGLVVVDVWCTEVRETATSNFTKSASAADTINNGTVQTAPASQEQSEKVVQ